MSSGTSRWQLKKTADCKALKDYHEEQIYSPFIF